MKSVFVTCLLLLTIVSASAQRIEEMEFRNQQVTDILLVLAEMAGTSIVPDETVEGTASYYFSDTDFETALELFLTTYKYYFWKKNNIYYVSKIKTEYMKEQNLLNVNADEVDITLLVRSISKQMGKTILYDALPRAKLTVHIKEAAPEEVLDIIIRRFPDYQLESTDSFFYIKRLEQGVLTIGQEQPTGKEAIKREGDTYVIETDKARFFDLIHALFGLENKEYSLLLKSDSILENLHYKDKTFSELLSLLLEQANADYAFANDIFYIFEVKRNDILKRYKTTEVIRLRNMLVEDVPPLLPQDLASGSLFKIDKKTNSIIIRGSRKEIDPVIRFLKQIDVPGEEKQHYRYDLKYLSVKQFIPLLPKKIRSASTGNDPRYQFLYHTPFGR